MTAVGVGGNRQSSEHKAFAAGVANSSLVLAEGIVKQLDSRCPYRYWRIPPLFLSPLFRSQHGMGPNLKALLELVRGNHRG